MKRLLALTVVLLLAASLLATITVHKVRVNGSSTIGGGLYYLVCDSTDTFQVDTLTSDVVDISNANDFVVQITVPSWSFADSANDSLEAIIHTILGFEDPKNYSSATRDKRHSDTLSVDTVVADSTSAILARYNNDSLFGTGVYFITILSDSFIQGEGYGTSSVTFDMAVIKE